MNTAHPTVSTAMRPMVAHSLRWIFISWFSACAATPESFPMNLAQNMNVAAEPNASMPSRRTWPVEANDTSEAHLEMSMPNGAMNMPMQPSIM